MDKDKKTLITFIILVIVGIFVYWPKGSKNKTAPRALPSEVKKIEELDKKKLIDLVSEDKNIQNDLAGQEWGERNPFDLSPLKAPAAVTAQSEVSSAQSFVLMGVLWGGVKPSAIINDNVFGVGETIEGWTVKAIEESMVVLTNGVNEVVLTMWQ